MNSAENLVLGKIFDEKFVCTCRKQCTNVVPLNKRKQLFKQYWSIGSFEGRCVILVNCISEKNRLMNGKHTFTIFGQEVCKTALTRTLQINEGRLAVALDKHKNCDTYADLRGKFSGGRNAFPPEKIDEIRRHISSFPKYVSHYTRNQTDSKYLNANLTLAEMYRLYTAMFQNDNPVSESVYKEIFYKDFNLRFKKPKKDTCKKCDIYKTKIQNADETYRQVLEEWHNCHLEEAELSQSLMKSDLENAEIDEKLETATYDMAKTQPCPRLPTNIVYYKRQLNLYNCGIHSGKYDKGIFNVWMEYEASKGTQEIGSCLKKFINNITAPVENLILWSDSCGGQNRSIRLVLMIIHVLQQHPSLKTISLRYLQSGHSFMRNDSDFGDFECALKRHEKVCTDVAYMKIMEDCRIQNKFQVNRMTLQDFFSIKPMEAVITNRKVDINKKKINWLETHEILLDKFDPNIIKLKKKINDDFQSVDLSKARCLNDFKNVKLEQLWPNGKPLSKEKLEDLMEMLELVDDEDKPFYDFLKDVETSEFIDDVDGFGEAIDFELEEE